MALDKELYSNLINDAYNNALKDVTTFRATILSIKARFLVTTEAGGKTTQIVDGLNPANFYEVILRPEFLSSVPAPWDMNDFTFDKQNVVIQGKSAIAAVNCHPDARSVTPEGNGNPGVNLKVGDVVVCTFGDGPNNQGRLRDIRFELNSVGEDEDLRDAIGVKGSLTNFLNNLSSGGKKLLGSIVDAFTGPVIRGPSENGNTIQAGGNLNNPESLFWIGKHKDNPRHRSKPASRTYIGSAVPSAKGEKIYNGVLDDKFFGIITIERGIYKNGNLDETEKPRTFKILKDALSDLINLNTAFRKEFGHDLPIASVNRSWERQIRSKTLYGKKAASPGNSKHGWGLAIDFFTKDKKYLIDNGTGFNSRIYKWLRQNGKQYNWINPSWAGPNGSNVEPWHFEWSKRSTVLQGEKDPKQYY